MEKKTAECRVGDALNIIVGRWKPIILLHLFENGTMRFNELKRKMPEITQKMLTLAIIAIIITLINLSELLK